MRLLFISFYYPPDFSAGSFRSKALVDALQREKGGNLQIDIITTMPNRYKSNSQPADDIEIIGSTTIRRYALSSHKSDIIGQSLSFVSFARQVLNDLDENVPWDMVYATSSRLMTAHLGARIAKKLNVPLYLDIRDMFSDTMKDVLGGGLGRFAELSIRFLEKSTYRQADRINLVSAGFLIHAKGIASNANFREFTNGIDPEFLTNDYHKDQSSNVQKPTILYAGNIGEGQGLHNILPVAAKALENRANFKLIGDGGKRDLLVENLRNLDCKNVELLPPVSRSELHSYYREADILFLHLNSYDAFLKVLPSKVFEYGATGKPILAGINGYSASFLKAEIEGAELFQPCDATDLVRAFDRLIKKEKHFPRIEFRHKFARDNIMNGMAKDIVSLAADS